MKIAVFGIPDFPVGKKIVPDECLDKLKELLHPPKVINIQIEFLEEQQARDADGIICLDKKKEDLILSDLELLEEKLNKELTEEQKQLLLRCQQELEKETLLNEINFSEEEKQTLRDLPFLTLKPVLMISADKASATPEITAQIYKMVGYVSFFTTNEKELRAWSIKKNTTAHEAAGLIHTDIQRGFIKAEVLACEDIIKSGGINQAKAKGLLHLEDKEYIVKDADLIKFRFNV